MSLFESSLIALALAMDCFTISIACGVMQRRMGMQVWAMAFMFGFFQAAMLLLGWMFAGVFSKGIAVFEQFDHFVAFALLVVLGGKMMWDSRNGKSADTCRYDPSKWVVLLTLSVATSIDALAVGFSLVGMGIRQFHQLWLHLIVVGAFSFVLSVFGKFIGVRVGKHIPIPAERMGGLILILIGCKVLYQHLFVSL